MPKSDIVKPKPSAKRKKGVADAKSKKKRKAPKDDEPSADEAESEPEPEDEVVDDDEQEAQETDDEEEGGEEEEEEEEDEEEDEEAAAERERVKKEKAEKKAAAAEKYAISKPRRLAKTRGFRQLAKKGGFSNQRPGVGQSKDVASNLVPIADVVRACHWKPCMPEDPAYGNLEEFKLRSDLANEPLPPGAAAIFRAGTEVFARELLFKATQAALDQGSTTITPAIMDGAVKPLRRVLRFSCGPPLGLVRHSQTCDVAGKLLRCVGDDERQIEADLVENGGIQKDQAAYAGKLLAKKLEKKAMRDANRAAREASASNPKAAAKRAGKA